ncbi:MAG: tetraacyldisaccharide 4'-kinase, partial [Desulfuromonadales bacterium]|nr:tetraacyldisaccharide 4'-kinase [Desulfuromonadales bacterium]
MERSWYRRRGWSLALIPLSWLFIYLVKRRRRYQEKRRRPLRLPVVVIGNITVGGTGKTP